MDGKDIADFSETIFCVWPRNLPTAIPVSVANSKLEGWRGAGIEASALIHHQLGAYHLTIYAGAVSTHR